VKILLIVNATASSVTARRKVVIQKALGSDHTLEVAETHRRGHAARLARGAALDDTDVVAVLAGDGTLNEAAGGVAGSDTALAALPGGSTNVYGRTIGVDQDPIDATSQLLDALDARSFERVGLGVANGRRFLFHLGIGYDARVIEWVERRQGLKRYAPHPLYVLAAVDTWFRRYDRKQKVRVTNGDGHEVGRGPFAIISKTSPYTYLGARGLNIAPEAGLETPLAATVFGSIDLPLILELAASALGTGKWLRNHKSVGRGVGLDRLVVTGDEPFPWQVDGDFLGDVDCLEVGYEPDALTLVVPRSP